MKSDWLRQRLLTYPPKQGRGNSFLDPVYLSRKPEWGSVEITRAMLDLLEDGLKIGNCSGGTSVQCEDKRFAATRYLVRYPPSFDSERISSNDIPPVDHFLYISESCLPVATAPEFFSNLSDSTISWVNARHRMQAGTPKNKYEDDQFAGINRRIPGQFRWKADQWLLLSRTHASKIIAIDRPHIPPKHQLWQSFCHINASDEMFFPTSLALLGYLRFTKDGCDTQKRRSRDEESYNGKKSTGENEAQDLAHSTVGTQSSSTCDSATTSTLPDKNPCILLKPVTYTDWSEGARNPATFVHGASDFKTIGKLARHQKCLVARKFATFKDVPGISSNAEHMTGNITFEQWIEVIEELQNEETKVLVNPAGEVAIASDDKK